MATAPPASASREATGELLTSPLIGTWRATVSLENEQEAAIFTFHPGGIFTSAAEGIHIAAGRWAATGHNTFAYSLWQILPSDLSGLPHRYLGEVQAMHTGRLDGDTMTSQGIGRQIDIDGNELRRGIVHVRATRFGIHLF
ncbi:hypothetical protein SMC26_19295 [Actinomadura fulvescens]